jgi:GT2 family glycosyltransferase
VALRSRDWIRRLGERLDEDRRAGIVGPKLVYPFEPYRVQCAGVAVAPSGRVKFMGRGEPRDAPEHNRGREVQCLISACFMVSRAVIDEAGGFDEAFNPVEYEDFDLCYRARSAGYVVLYEPSVEMYHFESVTTAGTAALPNTYLIIKNGLLFKRRWRHMFEHENGPRDEETKWRQVETRDFDSVGALPAVD